ncbi:MAG: peptidoglycan DD-metalloendopeptidase family protein [Kiloniellales bacterium]
MRPRAIAARILRLTGVLLLAGAFALPAMAQEDRLKAIERQLQQDQAQAEKLHRRAEAIEAEIQVLRAASIEAARRAQDYETRLFTLEAKLGELERREADKVAGLKARRTQLRGTLAALQRIALQPTDALIVAPGSPVDTVRSAMLLRVAIPEIERRARRLRDDLDALAELRQRIALQRDDLTATNQSLDTERQRITNLIGRKLAARVATTAEQKSAQARAARLAAQAKDLRDLMARIERDAENRAEAEARQRAEAEAQEREEREAREQVARVEAEPETPAPRAVAPPPPPPKTAELLALAKPGNIRPFPDPGPNLVVPARGRLVLRYGQSNSGNGESKGITIRGRRGAQVVAPFDGQVVYAGPFRRYGQILIIEHGGRYHTLLAGLDRIDAVVGQWLLAGEPIGVLGSPQDGHPELYLELRRAGQPINPLPWLATTGDKVRG